MLLKDFSGGRNSRVHPSLLNPNQAQIYTNIDNESNIISPVKGATSTGVVIDKYFTWYNAKQEWVSSAVDTDYVEYREILYSSSNGVMSKYDTYGDTYSVGIPKPNNTLVATFAKLDNLSAAINSGTGELAFNTYKYMIAVYSAVIDKWVYRPLTFTIGDLTLTNRSIDITIGALDANYFAVGTGVKIYRLLNSTYYKIYSGTYSNGMVVNDSNLSVDIFEADIDKYYNYVYTYTYTYYDSSTGVESVPATISEEVNGLGATIGTFDVCSDANANVDKIRIYRVGGILSNYTLVHEMTYTGVQIASYQDLFLDTDIADNHVLDSFHNYQPPSGIKYITTAYAMMFGAVKDKLYFSNIANPDAWPVTNFIDFDADITGIGALSNGLLVFTEFKTYIVLGTSPSTFTRYLLNGSQGCINHKTIQFAENSLLWVSHDGICMTSGGKIFIPTMEFVGTLTFLETYSAAILNNVYYLSYKTATADKIIALDFRYNKILRDIELPNGFMVVSAKSDIYQYYNGTLQILFSGTDLDIHYKSPMLTEGANTIYKIYKDVYINFTGSFTIKIYIDGNLVNTEDITGTNKIENLKIQGAIKGYAIEFDITGSGSIYEINYSVERND